MSELSSHYRSVLAKAPVAIAGSTLLLLALARPMLFTSSAQSGDWLKHLWQLWHQAAAIRANHAPTFFLHDAKTAFYPLYAFYGGTLYALTATLSLPFGHSPHTAYVLTYLAGFAAAYGGWYWLARLAGLGRWTALAPGTAFITSQYYLALVYGRGDWPEFIGVSTIPLLIAAGCEVLFAERLRLLPGLALAAAAIVFFGSHSLTILWGSTLMILLGLGLLIGVPSARARITRRGVLRLGSIVMPSILVNAWFLLPALVYQGNTNIAAKAPVWHRLAESTSSFLSTSHLFRLSLTVPAASKSLPIAVGLPVLVIAWLCVTIAILLRRGTRDPWTRALLIVTATTLAMGLIMTDVGALLLLPRPYTDVQFTFRLESYVLLGISGALLATLAATDGRARSMRLWRWVLLPILLLAVIGAIQQVDSSPTAGKTSLADLAKLDPEYGDYVNINLPFIANVSKLPRVSFPPEVTRGDHASLTVSQPPGTHVDTNLLTYTDLVHISGAGVLGYGPHGELVLEVGAGSPESSEPGSNAQTISLSPANPPAVSLGHLLTIVGMAALLVRLGAPLLVGPRLRRRRRDLKPRAPPSTEGTMSTVK